MISILVYLKSMFIEFILTKYQLLNYFTKLEIHQECNMNDNLVAEGILRNLDKLDFNSCLHDA